MTKRTEIPTEKKQHDWACPECGVAIGNVRGWGRERRAPNLWTFAFECLQCDHRWPVVVHDEKQAAQLGQVFFDDGHR